MSQQRSTRASKLRAAYEIALMAKDPPPTSSQRVKKKMTLKFPAHIWNAYDPTTSAPPQQPLNPTSVTAPNPASDNTNPRRSKSTSSSPKRPRQCKVKLTHFQYGGPKARVDGNDMDQITFETPCLEPTCVNCWKYRRHLMEGPLGGDEMENVEQTGAAMKEQKEEKEALKRCDSVIGWCDGVDGVDGMGGVGYQRRDVVCLTFSSAEGRERFKNSLRVRNHKGWRQEKARLKSPRGETKPRRRHRLRLVFKSKVGKKEYARVLEKVCIEKKQAACSTW